MHYPDPSFSVDTTASDAPLIVFAIKEHNKLISILEKRGKKHTQMKLFKFHIDFFLDGAKGMNGSDLTSPLQKQK